MRVCSCMNVLHVSDMQIRTVMLSLVKILPLSCLVLLGACVSAEDEARETRRTLALSRLERALVVADSMRRFDSVRAAQLLAAEEEFPAVTYSTFVVSDRHQLDSVRKAFDYGKVGSSAYKAFVTMNRRVFSSIRVGDTIVVPDKIHDDMLAYSVFPQRWFGADAIGKIVVISNEYQAYACYENGRQVRFASCNTGTERKPTLPGRYAVNWKERLRISSLNDEWKLPFNVNFHLYAGNAFHQFYMPGRPASHSCVRQFMDDAEWLYNWVEVGEIRNGRVQPMTGTPVIIVDMFDYTRKKYGPWVDLAGNRSDKLELPEDPMGMEEALIPISQIPQSVRGSLPDYERYRTAEDTLRARGVIREEVRLSPSIEYTRLRKEKEERQRKLKEQQAKEKARAEAAQSTPSDAPAE